MSGISHKNCTGRLPIFGCCGEMWSYYILGFSLPRHTTLIFFYFSRLKQVLIIFHWSFRAVVLTTAIMHSKDSVIFAGKRKLKIF
jgi:hypothetical protein